MEDLRKYIRDIPDFPKEGIVFKDITTLIGDTKAFNHCIDLLVERYREFDIDVIMAIEARGFIFGGALAILLKKGLVPVRKAGKLPYETIKATYELEYGTDTIEIHKDAIKSGQRVLLIDDLLATGGTALASIDLVRQSGGEVVECGFVIELEFLKGREKLKPCPVFSLIKYKGE